MIENNTNLSDLNLMLELYPLNDKSFIEIKKENTFAQLATSLFDKIDEINVNNGNNKFLSEIVKANVKANVKAKSNPAIERFSKAYKCSCIVNAITKIKLDILIDAHINIFSVEKSLSNSKIRTIFNLLGEDRLLAIRDCPDDALKIKWYEKLWDLINRCLRYINLGYKHSTKELIADIDLCLKGEKTLRQLNDNESLSVNYTHYIRQASKEEGSQIQYFYFTKEVHVISF